jgi:3-hydroxybutyrate dehydrogenase
VVRTRNHMLNGKNAIVTGSTSGIGLVIAQALAEQGCNILLNGLDDTSEIDKLVADTAKQFNVRTFFAGADMGRPAEIADMVRTGERNLGSVDILVNNAGIQFTAPIEEFPGEKWDAIIAINLSAAFHAIKTALPGMKARAFGRIVNIASVHGLVASENKVAYVSAKHGLLGLTKTVALETASTPVTCNAICPGWVQTPLVQRQIAAKAKENGTSVDQATKDLLVEKEPSQRFTHAKDIAAMATFLCSDHASNITGAAFTLDGGWTAQ